MEEAFLLYCNNKFSDALTKYQSLERDSYTDQTLANFIKKRYVLQFRMGELYHLTNDMEKALSCFDKYHAILDGTSTGTPTEHIDPLIRMMTQVRLSSIFWSLGEEYFDLAIERHYEAVKIFKSQENAPFFEQISHEDKVNYEIGLEINQCWLPLAIFVSKVDQIRKMLKEKHLNPDNHMTLLNKCRHYLQQADDAISRLNAQYNKLSSPDKMQEDKMQVQMQIQVLEAWKHYSMFRAGAPLGQPKDLNIAQRLLSEIKPEWIVSRPFQGLHNQLGGKEQQEQYVQAILSAKATDFIDDRLDIAPQ